MFTTIPERELIVLLDDTHNEIGFAPKLASHHEHTPLHKGFSCYVFNDQGKFLVTQRAVSKKVWPGVWTNSVCGHPGPEESYELAIARRGEEELGMTLKDITVVLPDYSYKTPPFNGIIENEFCPVFVARLIEGPVPNAKEIESYNWVSWPDYLNNLASKPAEYSYWAKDQALQLKNHPIVLRYATSL